MVMTCVVLSYDTVALTVAPVDATVTRASSWSNR